MSAKDSSESLPRRNFIKNSIGLAAAAAVGGPAAIAAGGNAAATPPVHNGAAGAYAESLRTPIVGRYQVIVAGGGPSGVIAAAAAARSGAKTLLIERYAFLGGNGVAGLMIDYNGFRHQRAPEALQTVKGIPAEYIAELVRLGGIIDQAEYAQVKHDVTKGDIPYSVGFDPEAAKIASLNLIRKEGVTLRLHSWIVGPMMDGSRVTGIIVESKSGRQAIAADIVIDATGDGDVAARAGAPFMSPVAPGKGNRMEPTLMYRLPDRKPHWGPTINGIDGTNVEDLTRAEVEARLELWDKIQTQIKRPGHENEYLVQTATGIGVRETRRILGEYVLKEEEAIKGVRFPDVIAISSNPFPSYNGRRLFLTHEGFDVPYRTLVPQKIEGVVLTGRCISCEQVPFQSARSMAPAMAIGHASGCAAALAATTGVAPRKLDVKVLQKLLLSQKAELRQA
jgi:hypothetical protein